MKIRITAFFVKRGNLTEKILYDMGSIVIIIRQFVKSLFENFKSNWRLHDFFLMIFKSSSFIISVMFQYISLTECTRYIDQRTNIVYQNVLMCFYDHIVVVVSQMYTMKQINDECAWRVQIWHSDLYMGKNKTPRELVKVVRWMNHSMIVYAYQLGFETSQSDP